ncbi:acyl-CoA dehydrogenase family protein [Actinomadura madurae]|uniref:acyl-CoA dehydrogenase family protein n=1 Tax=Actinomadura madurae TaxID=1993 RepID=UPI00202675EC|nr:acyl-CoA dehydrogenase family protein [Actinomadura madurae]MCP9965040.1 acyl-CoA dehydrogenase family protein [Actinomadura madurae]MCQ0013716.1 acyl-CoA dehydrogenase family protein [Actinomadura madurae]URM93928.1 acyl-CoA dehydrogenase family protein [Actinomadura madurae]URN04652.1 acyl-CoA dehydrogenase family protein [Actinomadura madurae]
MDFSRIELDDEQRAFEAEVREVFENYWTPDPHALNLDHERPSKELIEQLAERGWVHPRSPRSRGGAELDAVRARILDLLQVEYRVPRFGNDLILSTVRKYGSDQLRATALPALESGRASFCLGYSEPDSGSDMAAARTRAVRNGDEWVINGAKMFTTYAEIADYVFLLARTGPVEEKHRSLTMFLVPMDTPGIEVKPISAMGHVGTNMTFYRDVRVPDGYRLGPVGEGWRVVSEPLATEHGAGEGSELAELNGSMGSAFVRTLEEMLELAVEWARTTELEPGVLAIDDPLVRHALAGVLLDIEVEWNTPSEFGKVTASETLLRDAEMLFDLMAPAGVLAEGADGAVAQGSAAWARAMAPATQIYGGTTDIWRNNVGRGSLGLPRGR